MQIARGLAAFRARADRTQTQVAKRAGVSVGTVNRYESWQDRARLRVPTVRAIAEACGASPAEISALVELVTSQESGWWMDHPGSPELLEALLSFEHYAEYENIWANALVPALLQTPRYALALHQAEEVRTDPADIATKVDARMRRQAVLDRTPPLHLWAVIDQAVLSRSVGGPDVMREQIDHLIKMSERPNIDVQILPTSAGAHAAGSGGHFVILGRDDEHDPMASMAVVYLELHRRGLYLDSAKDVGEYKIMFDYLRSASVGQSESRRLLAAARQEHE